MREMVYRIFSAVPSKALGGLGLGITAWSAGSPKSFKTWWDWLMTPEQIRLCGIIGLGVFLAYWIALFLLKPRRDKKGKADPGTYSQTHSGSGDNRMDF